jgi:MraZ protein
MVKLTKSGFFLGEYRHNLTDKNRLALPKRIRVEIEGYDLILSRGFEPCIAGFDKSRWKELAKEQLAVQFNEERGRQLRRQLFSSAVPTELDGQGRMVLPESLITWAGLKGKVGEELIVIGAGDHFEIWESNNWNAYMKRTT